MTFAADSSKIRDFRKQYSEGDGKWTSTHNVYLHGTSAPFRKEGCTLCYMYIYSFGVGICCFLSLIL